MDTIQSIDMARAHKIPLILLFAIALLVAAGELATGTNLYFVAMVATALAAAGIIYNLLGGLSTISGIAFSVFALNGLIIGQFAKLFLFERADQGLLVPNLTITVYTVFYLSLMVGVFLFGWIRLRLPRPVEPVTSGQSKVLYVISLGLGLPATILFTSLNLAGPDAAQSSAHGLAVLLRNLLPFSLVIALDHRIRSTEGRHSFGWMALWPVLGMAFMGFVTAGRGGFATPALIILVTCYIRGYRLRRRHYAAIAATIFVFFVFISPYYLYVRQFRGSGSFREEASKMFGHLLAAPGQWSAIRTAISATTVQNERAGSYFSRPGTETLNRFALIAPDSALINACSTGFHYGFKSVKMDVLSQVPHFLFKDKPDFGSDAYLGQIDGLEHADIEGTTFSTITSVADAYGAFGWLSAILFPMVGMPFVLVVFESMFDISRPWGTVAAVTLAFEFGAMTMGSNIVLMTKTPLQLILVSWVLGGIVRYIPVRGDRSRNRRQRNLISQLPAGELADPVS